MAKKNTTTTEATETKVRSTAAKEHDAKLTATAKVSATLSQRLRCVIYLTEEMLGAKPGDKNIFFEYIESQSPAPITTIEEMNEDFDTDLDDSQKGMSVFLRRTKGEKLPCIEGYTWNGFFKEAITAIKYNKELKGACAKLTAHKKKIDLNSIIRPKYVDLHLPEGKMVGVCQRPLRASTAQGERIALACSETVPPMTWCEFNISTTPELVPVIIECLTFGADHGTGQWRGSGHKGTFVYELFDEEGTLIANTTESVIGCLASEPQFEELFKEFLEGDIL